MTTLFPAPASLAGQASSGAPLGEIVESSTLSFLAQACVLDEAPPFGSFVRVTTDNGLVVYGVVAFVETAGIDPGARAVMRGHDDVRDRRIYEENPDLPHVLRTLFQARIVGFSDGATFYQYLPPRPPHLHYSVLPVPRDQVRAFTEAGLDYLDSLLTVTDIPADELVAASTRLAAATHAEPALFVQQVGRHLAHLLRADYPRLASILRRMVLAPPTFS